MANFSAYARILCSVSIIVFYELTESSSDIFSDPMELAGAEMIAADQAVLVDAF